MDDITRQNTINRLKSVRGHLNGIINMLEDDRYCIDIIKQIQATQAALARTSEVILANHLDTCVTTAMQGDDAGERQRVMSEILEVFRTENRSKA
ncbi:MAG: metal-sensitive transcriptional regulator [Chloroflexi bacterium]|nr:metal-sensitive transcriptional regulator [Chloroflexota bacterium]